MQIAPGRCWRACCEIRPGETLVVVRLDRLARSVSHALAVIEQPCDNSTDEKAQLAQGQAGKPAPVGRRRLSARHTPRQGVLNRRRC